MIQLHSVHLNIDCLNEILAAHAYARGEGKSVAPSAVCSKSRLKELRRVINAFSLLLFLFSFRQK